MLTDIFVSRPTMITRTFEAEYAVVETWLRRKGYRARRVGADAYTMDAPLKGVMDLMKKCRGAIILGYPQYHVTASLSKGGKAEQKMQAIFPTPWNQIEATLAFRRGIPVLVVAHNGVSGGIFDYGVTGEYVHATNLGRKDWHKDAGFQALFCDWEKRVK